MLASALAADKEIEVVGMAADAYIARNMILELQPDVITLDIEMPRMDGITFLKKLMQYKPLPVIIISSLGQAAAQASMDALRAGAVEILAKPNGPYSIGELGHTLADKIRAASTAKPRMMEPQTASAEGVGAVTPMARAVPARAADGKLIAIGASTGGPGALADVLRTLPEDGPPIVVVQHMPAGFTKHLAERLNRDCRIAVKEAEDGEYVHAGQALVAPGNFHMTVKRQGNAYQVLLGDGPLVCFSRPSVDVLFTSVAAAAGKDATGVLLTGMGADGARGLLAMRENGAATIAQNEDTCVVFGMPKEAIRMGAVQAVLPLEKIANALMRPAAVLAR